MIISIHAPLAGCDSKRFNSSSVHLYFNPRTPCGVRPVNFPSLKFSFRFQSTHPLRGATLVLYLTYYVVVISIHAPLAGCDTLSVYLAIRSYNFNPRTPCGVRRKVQSNIRGRRQFQSTHPLRGATSGNVIDLTFVSISIHAPLAGCDQIQAHGRRYGRNFNPRTPCGVRPSISSGSTGIPSFQSTHPLRGATFIFLFQGAKGAISIHAPLAGCDSISCANQRLAPPTKGGLIKK